MCKLMANNLGYCTPVERTSVKLDSVSRGCPLRLQRRPPLLSPRPSGSSLSAVASRLSESTAASRLGIQWGTPGLQGSESESERHAQRQRALQDFFLKRILQDSPQRLLPQLVNLKHLDRAGGLCHCLCVCLLCLSLNAPSVFLSVFPVCLSFHSVRPSVCLSIRLSAASVCSVCL
jgi:hypothetical protein